MGGSYPATTSGPPSPKEGGHMGTFNRSGSGQDRRIRTPISGRFTEWILSRGIDWSRMKSGRQQPIVPMRPPQSRPGFCGILCSVEILIQKRCTDDRKIKGTVSPSFDVWSKSKETIKRSASRNIRFIQVTHSVVKSTHLNPYSSKFSKKIYTQHQLLVLILFKDFRNQHYREFIEDIGDMEGVQEILDLSEVPHFTTLQKFLCRIKTLYLRITFKKTVNLFYSSDENIPITAIDSSGFTSGYCSHYFSERTGKIRKHFLKSSISVDTDQQIITGFVASNSRVHDTRHAVKLLRQCHKIRKSDCYVMDKGYDSEAIHQLIREDLHANSVIPIRSWNNENIGGKYRQEMACQFNDMVYPRRQLVENKFSVLKRKFSGDLKARRFLIQMKEIANKMIVCNIHSFLLFLMVEVFYRAEFCVFLRSEILLNREFLEGGGRMGTNVDHGQPPDPCRGSSHNLY